MFKLIRDKIPNKIRDAGGVCNFATTENIELYIDLLKSKLIEEVSEFLESGDIMELVDTLTVIKTYIKAIGYSEEDFDKLYKEKLKTNGGFEKRYIGFFPDPQPVQQPVQQEEIR